MSLYSKFSKYGYTSYVENLIFEEGKKGDLKCCALPRYRSRALVARLVLLAMPCPIGAGTDSGAGPAGAGDSPMYRAVVVPVPGRFRLYYLARFPYVLIS